ncbi:hypothetical protein P3L10_012623 [Capsicum annuum]
MGFYPTGEQLVGRELRKAVKRGMRNRFPGPYGLEVGSPKDVPEGYEEKWLMNLHVIDTRGVEERFGCIECRLKKGPRGLKKGFYLKYTVKYVDWDAASIVPVKVHIFDITDSWEKLETSTAVAKHQCQIEYSVESCFADENVHGCTHEKKKMSVPFPSDSDVIYGVAHQGRGAFHVGI